MASIFFGETFAFEDVTEVATAGGTGDFGASAVGVYGAEDRTGERVVKTGPAAVAIEFALRSEEWCFTAAAYKSAFVVMVYIFTGKGRFGALVYYDASFFGSEFVILHGSILF